MVFDRDKWIKTTEDCNETVCELQKILAEQRTSFIDELNRICMANGLPIKTIKGSSDNSVFEIHFVGNTSNSIHFSKKFLRSLDMDFSVQRKLDRNARNELYLEVYPLGM